MQISLIEPKLMRYIYVNPVTNNVHLLVPFVAGQDVSTDNTCRSKTELKAFFSGGAYGELEVYKSVLEFHILLLEERDQRCSTKKERLNQVNIYLETVFDMQSNYESKASDLLSKPCNLYSMQLRPRKQDSLSRVVNPVFTINRGNNLGTGGPLSPLYHAMHEAFPKLILKKPDPRTQLVNSTLKDLPQNASFENIQLALTNRCQTLFGVTVNFKHYIESKPGGASENQTVDKAHVDSIMGFEGDATTEQYIDALLGFCASNLWETFTGSPFYLDKYKAGPEQAERLSMMTQFYLGVLNIYCRARGISDENFGQILDNNAALSEALVDSVSQALTQGREVEHAIVDFVNTNKNIFKLSSYLTPTDTDKIQHKFEITYRTVTATKENPHMDDFMILDIEARGEKNVFFTQNGLICTDFANMAPITGPYQGYFTEIREEAATHPDVMRPQDEPFITIDIEPEALVYKLGDERWDKLPKEVLDACHALPLFRQLPLFWDNVAKGNQEQAEAILASDHKKTILTKPAQFTDYSGRTFHCTAYEYAYWAKDTHMCRMLERYMDNETKTQMLEKIDAIERSGLAYQRYGVPYQNPHYDMSFVLKNLDYFEFRALKHIAGQKSPKMKQATVDNYKNISFTATEYEQLKKEVKQLKQNSISLGFFSSTTVVELEKKLKFDFKSLILALDTYVTNYDKWNSHQRQNGLFELGQAQRDVPAHIAHEYCNPGRSFGPLPSFNEDTLLRNLTVSSLDRNINWFPLSLLSSGLGFDFCVSRTKSPSANLCKPRFYMDCLSLFTVDLAAVRLLDEVRTADLALSRDILEMPSLNRGLGLS